MANHTHISTQHDTGYDSLTGRLMRRASLFSLAVGVTLVVIKAVAWSFTGSLSIMSSLADSILDVMASTINFVAVRYALQPPDKEHRFGHGKAEDLATLAQSTFICGSGLFLIIEGIKRLFSPEPIDNSFIGIAAMLVSVVMSLSLVAYQRHVVRKTSSSIIAADALHYFTDFLTNASVIVALVICTTTHWAIADPIIALIIAATIIYGAYEIGSKAFQNLMDHEFSDAERTQIIQLVQAHPEIMGLHDLRTRKSGMNCFIQFHLEFKDENITLKQAHIISDQIENTLMEAFPKAEILVHQDHEHDDLVHR